MYELDIAVINGRIDIAYILSHRATVNTFILAIKCGRLEIIQIFLKTLTLPVGAHILAIKYGHLNILQWMHNVLNLFTVECNLFYTAICYGRYEILMWLISIGYPTDAGDAIMIAGCYQHVAMVDWVVLNHLADVCTIDMAALHGDVDMVKLCLLNGRSYTNAAIYWAAANGYLEVLKCFANLTYNTILLKYAISSGNLELVQWMYPNYSDKNAIINEAVWHGKVNILQWLGPGNNICLSTILKAIEHGYVDVIKWLFEMPNHFTKTAITKMYKKSMMFNQCELQLFFKRLIASTP